MLRRVIMAVDGSTPSAGDPFWANVSSLLHFDGVDGSIAFTDQKGLVWSVAGTTPKVSTTNSKFGGASLSINTAGSNYIHTPNSTANFSPVTDFTCEAWIYRTVGGAQNDEIFVCNGGASAGSIGLAMNSSGFLQGYLYNDSGTSLLAAGTTVVPTAQWVHVAVVRAGSNLHLFQDGIKIKSIILTGSITVSPSGGAYIGNNPLATARTFDGYIDDFRFTQGVARYAANFTPPTQAFPDGPEIDPYYADVIALLHLDGTDGSTTITDETGRTWTATGNASIDTAARKFGTGSCFFDGTTDAVATASLGIGTTEDFTIDFWARANEIQGSTFFDARPASGQSFLVTQPGADNTSVQFYAGAVSVNSGAGTLSLTEFNLFSLERHGDVARIYVNGVLAASASGIGIINWNASSFSMGKSIATSSNFHGWIDDVRITKGVARYKGSNFTPPVVAWPQD